ncbi:MAG: endonuclease MutS2 [Oscillospiraceae bacterium]|nr:endonuclease MutS2 [Oscillospiraceae bacterium]
MTLFEKSMNILELPAVLEMLRRECVSDGAKAAALALRPSTERAEVEKLLDQTDEARRMMVLHGSPSFSGVSDIEESLKRANAGGMLNTRELMAVASVLRSAREVLAYASGDEAGGGAIGWLFSALRANKYLEEKITNSIIGEDEIADSASSELADIRRKMRVAGDRVRQALQKIITSPSYQKALQEPIITVKNGRYVVPVKAEHKASVPGLTHDVSSSGATLFIEPMSAVKANNEIRELLSKEQREIERILRELSAETGDFSEDIGRNASVLRQLDLIFAKAKLSYQLDGTRAAISEKGQLDLHRARHPLISRDTVVPIDICLGGGYDTLVITGPNTGGKTVSLKTLGLLCLMTQCGLHIPARDGSTVPVFGKILADIGDEQSIEQSLSTFSAHMTNIVAMLDECDDTTLALFDELGAGTDPAEGAALAVSIIEYARKFGTRIAATTHYAELKIFAMTTAGVMNASCEFDVKTLKPTYRLILGVPGKSNAFAISERLGIPGDIIRDAQSRMDSGDKNFEEALRHLEEARTDAERLRSELDATLETARRDGEAARKLRHELETEREKMTKSARREAQEILDDARRQADSAFKEIERLRKTAGTDTDWQRLNEAKAALRRGLNEAEEKVGFVSNEEEAPSENRPAVKGDTVEVRALGLRATVSAVEKDGTLALVAGNMRISARQDEVRVIKAEQPKQKPKPQKSSVSVPSSTEGARSEVDLRGMSADEAVITCERFIDTASMRHMEEVRVIHGKGTGVLRDAIRQMLRRNKEVKTFRPGIFGEGEDGVTIVTLKQ